MKRIIRLPIILIVLLMSFKGFSQEQKIADSLRAIYEKENLKDTTRMDLLLNLSYNEINDLHKAIQYAAELIMTSRKAENDKYLRAGYFLLGTKKRLLGNYDEALDAFFKSAELAKKLKQVKNEGDAYGAIADAYSESGDHKNARLYYNKSINVLRNTNDSANLASVLFNSGDEFYKVEIYDTASLFFTESKLIFEKINYQQEVAYCIGGLGMVYERTGENDLAEKYLTDAIRMLEEAQNYDPVCEYLISLSDVYLAKGDVEQALNLAKKSLTLAERNDLRKQIADANLKLSEIYDKKGNSAEAFNYYKKHIAYRDSVTNLQSVRKMGDLRIDYEMSQKQIEVNLLNQQKRNQKIINVSLAIILGLSIIILGILFRNYYNKQKAYRILNLQKQETDEQKAKAENALDELQATQKQLIQSAKMASLGELTAGIAHEIQNPLNFVNNFSELSVDLLSELKDGPVSKLTDSDKMEVDEIINVLADNFKKINDHGRRADSIVKGMLQHSRTTSGNKEPTDINALADEYLRLSYHGLRAKDKAFNSSFTTSFDRNIGKIEIVPQDIGRVLLNLYNNAFYAVNHKKKNALTDFEPVVVVTTKRVGNKVEITVKDNGTGIPQNILHKVFHPFFTTKPTGQGTGLGLSLSYDIVKAHGGELKVETKEGEFTEFIIQLPVSNKNGA